MATSGFDCPEGTRLIIQMPNGHFTALVQGKVLVNMVIEPGARGGDPGGFWWSEPDKVVGASLDLHFDIDWEDDYLYRVAAGKYEDT